MRTADVDAAVVERLRAGETYRVISRMERCTLADVCDIAAEHGLSGRRGRKTALPLNRDGHQRVTLHLAVSTVQRLTAEAEAAGKSFEKYAGALVRGLLEESAE